MTNRIRIGIPEMNFCAKEFILSLIHISDPAYKLREGGCLADIAPTLIELMGMEQPKEMTGKSLLVK